MKTLITLFLLFVGGVLISQNYYPIPASNTAKWSSSYSYLNSSFQVVTDDHNYIAVGDSLIGSKTYNKILRKANVAFGGYSETLFLLYNDTITKKVYQLISGNDELLYDFNLQLGDTVKEQIISSGNDYYVVTKIDSVLINSRYHKRYSDTTVTGEVFNWIIEGIGGKDLIYILNGFESSVAFFCYSENNQVVYGDTLCNLTVSVQENIKLLNFDIYPNPATDQLIVNLQGNETATFVKLISSSGQIVKELGKQNTNNIQVDVSDLPKGIYFIQVQTEKGFGNSKFMKN